MSLEPDAVTQRQDAPGKRLLMEAALRLASSRRSLSSIGLRELAREAGLNPNTFYRHFADVDDLGLAIIRDIATQLRQPLRELRREAAGRAPAAGGAAATPLGLDFARGQRVCEETVRLFFDFVERHPEAFIIGVRELHGPSAVLREALGQVMDDFGADMAGCRLFMAQLSLDYLELPEGQRGEVCALAERQVLLLFTGAAVLQALGL
ncbi:TetR family transcriptional regulator [Pseudomonas citronellolis]|uniref:TetR family transcriptional regulator n=1 Tax=Pseudomonas citronellolis TaxID=53408 RepID=UPI0022BA3487|nr:TetR family transcriptional regulator [Pseudomonas citronellolis]WBG62394.1 TetR family transcriptional regulator [Pseudomonas citronellolis]